MLPFVCWNCPWLLLLLGFACLCKNSSTVSAWCPWGRACDSQRRGTATPVTLDTVSATHFNKALLLTNFFSRETLTVFFFCLAGKCKHFKLALRSVCSYESTLGSSVGVFRTCLKPDVTVKGRYRNNCVPDFKPAQSETETNALLSWEVLEHAH